MGLVRGKAAARNNDLNMRIKFKSFAESMKYGDDAWSTVFLFFGPGDNRLGSKLKQSIEHELAV